MNARSGSHIILVAVILSMISGFVYAQNTVPTPEKFFGFTPGADRMLFRYEKLISYLEELDQQSDRLQLTEIGRSPLNKPIYIAFFSDPANIAVLDRLKSINKQLALDANLEPAAREALVDEGKVFVLGTLSMHSGEVGPSQSAATIAYELVTTKDEQMLKMLRDVVYMMVPCHNPDGMNMVVDHYNRYKGTRYEGSSLPGVYHKYVGHDNNRDFVILSQTDTKAIARIYNLDWFPQVMMEKHQMGSLGPRYFVPPNHDPIAQNIDALIWNWSGIFGANLIKHMTAAGLSGVSQHYLFDDYWPGSTETCIWKNVIGFLTEAASSRYATPIYIEPNELRVGGKGLSEYKKGINMPSVWPGGWWRLSDIVEYEIQSTWSILTTAHLYKDEILDVRNRICREEVNRGLNQAPYYYVLPRKQHDAGELAGLVNLLQEHGIKVYTINKDIDENGWHFRSGDLAVPLAQPFRPFIKEVMEKQKFPVRHYTPGGKIIRPYDITTWSLPLHRGVKSHEVQIRLPELERSLEEWSGKFTLLRDTSPDKNSLVFSANHNESYMAAFRSLKAGITVKRADKSYITEGIEIPAGSFIMTGLSSTQKEQVLKDLAVSPVAVDNVPANLLQDVKMPRMGLIETYFHDMDAGWTRFIFDTYAIPFKVIRPGEVAGTDLEDFDILIFPDSPKSILMEGKWKSADRYYMSNYPPEYTKGIGKEGLTKILKFINSGGQIISWGRSSNLFTGTLEITQGKNDTEEFQLPFRELSKSLQKDGLYCPGSLVQVNLRRDHPLTWGTQPSIGVFYRGRPVFQTSLPRFDMDRRVIARFPEENILMSGYCENEKLLADKSVMIWLKKGQGQLVLFGFNPQFRASTPVAYKLLFNAILL